MARMNCLVHVYYVSGSSEQLNKVIDIEMRTTQSASVPDSSSEGMLDPAWEAKSDSKGWTCEFTRAQHLGMDQNSGICWQPEFTYRRDGRSHSGAALQVFPTCPHICVKSGLLNSVLQSCLNSKIPWPPCKAQP